jgi:hypothetical protein
MQWFWKVRIYSPKGDYSIVEVITTRDLHQIDLMQDFYSTLTGCKMLLEGMSEYRYENLPSINFGFSRLFNLKDSS